MTLPPDAPEAAVKTAVKALLRKHGAYWYMPVPGGFGVRGAPDFFTCHRGLFLGLETKRAGVTKLSPFQEEHRAAILAAGGAFLVINARNLADLEGWLSR